MPPNYILPDSTQNTRIDYIDIFRSFGIILMVMGHIGYGKAFDLFIHAFHMPMFFWISGYLFSYKAKEEISFISKKALSIESEGLNIKSSKEVKIEASKDMTLKGSGIALN